MRMRDKILVLLLLAVILIPAVHAADMFGGLGTDMIDSVMKIVSYEVTFPAASIYGQTYAATKAPLWAFAFIFMLIFAILWNAVGQIPLFKNNENTGSKKAFTIAFTALIVLGTPAAPMVYSMIGAFTFFAFILLVVLGFYTIWTIFRGGWASNKTDNARSAQSMATAVQASAEARRDRAQTLNYDRKTLHAFMHGLNQQVTAIRIVRHDLEDVLGRLQGISFPVPTAVSQRIDQTMGRISIDMGKIITYTTANDRMTAAMSKANYTQTNGENLAGLDATGAAEIKKDTDTETNDFGRTITDIAQVVRTGINQNNIHNLIAWTISAINITQRMERDISAQEQMINKI